MELADYSIFKIKGSIMVDKFYKQTNGKLVLRATHSGGLDSAIDFERKEGNSNTGWPLNSPNTTELFENVNVWADFSSKKH